ncbi:hypothetical protein JYT25_00915 [bacterium AH-315-C20]|nr:hypothetical protein [bacterium AH-315-C20]
MSKFIGTLYTACFHRSKVSLGQQIVAMLSLVVMLLITSAVLIQVYFIV